MPSLTCTPFTSVKGVVEDGGIRWEAPAPVLVLELVLALDFVLAVVLVVRPVLVCRLAVEVEDVVVFEGVGRAVDVVVVLVVSGVAVVVAEVVFDPSIVEETAVVSAASR